MIISFLLVFLRVTIGIVFALSFWGKAQGISGFVQTIDSFSILPRELSKVMAVLFLSGELVIMVSMFVGGPFLTAAFALAVFLLLIFTIALASVLIRNMQIPCNCFGAGELPVAAYDLWRNSGFILCAAGGIISRFGDVRPLTWFEWSVIAVPALVFVILLIHLGEIAALFRPVGEK